MTPPSKGVVRLVRRPGLSQDESLRGYILRLTFENNIGIFSKALSSLAAATRAIADVAYASNLSASILRGRLTLAPSSRSDVAQVNILGVLVPMNWIVRNTRRICPECLMEHGHMSIFWEISLIKTCFWHSAYLISDCQQCRQPLLWENGSLLSCGCGAALTNFVRKPAADSCTFLDLILAECLQPTCLGTNYVFDAGYANLLDLTVIELMEQICVLSEVIVPHLKGLRTSIWGRSRDAFDAQLVLNLSMDLPRSLEIVFFIAVLDELKLQSLDAHAQVLRRNMHHPVKTLMERFKFGKSLLEFRFMRNHVLPSWHRAQLTALSSVLGNLRQQQDMLGGVQARLKHQMENSPVRLNARFRRLSDRL